MTALICGSYAFDNIMVFPDHFKNHILPDKVHMLNVSFMVPEMRRVFGGCAGNIAYNLNLLGGKGLPMATVGKDFGEYAEWMKTCGISNKHIKVIDDSFTGQAYITTDLADNQITAFHPGAMSFSHQNKVSDAKADNITIGIVSPDGFEGMTEHAAQFAEADIPFIFDPGQGMPMFDGDQLMAFVEQASYVTLNDYEAQLMMDRTGLAPRVLARSVGAVIVTRGGEGSTIYTQDGGHMEIPPATPKEISDPTGCGDAYRAGLLYGLMNELDWDTTGRIASLMGAIKVESSGTQNHSFTMDEFAARYQETFSRSL